MLIPSLSKHDDIDYSSLSRRVNANSQPHSERGGEGHKLIKKGEC